MQNNLLEIIHAKSLPTPFEVWLGISDQEIKALISYTKQDSEVQSKTSDFQSLDGSPGRFSSLKSYQDWYAQGKFIYTLKDQVGNLLGIAWFSKDPQVFNGITFGFTFALRLYGIARGIGLAKPFASLVSKHFFTTDGYQSSPDHGVWLRTSCNNLPAIKTYQSLGYSQVTGQSSGDKVAMVLQYQSL